MKKKKVVQATALALAGTVTLQTVDFSALQVLAQGENDREVDEKLAYFVDCGDYDVTTLSEGDAFGQYNSVTEQVYGKDPVTGKKWGIVDKVSTPLKNGTAAVTPNAAYTDDTWPNEWCSGDGMAKTESNRYTKNQFENGIARNLHYAFELPNGTYTVETYFVDPWNCSQDPNVSLEGEEAIQSATPGLVEKSLVTVTDGELNLDITAPSEGDNHKCINLAYIKIYFGDITQEDTAKPDEEEKENIEGMQAYDLSDVRITDAYLSNAEEKDIAYLLSLDSDKLLAGFRETAGIDMKGATRYTGWENSLIGGHTMGHYLTAMAQAVAELPDTDARKQQVEEKLNGIIDGLFECQKALGTGYIFGATLTDKNNVEAQFDNVEKGRTNIGTEAWVPWYTMHKIMAGLVDTYKYTGNETALEVAKNLGDWVYQRASGWSESTRNIVLGIEYGGMNDCLYELYDVTGEDKYAEAAHLFDEDNLFKLVATGADNVLNNRHANTTIPKFLGALNRYVTTDGKTINGEVVDATAYLEYAEKFFDMVVNKHSYITGDNSEWEHFGADNVLDAERTNCNCETCNAYNMLKLAKGLYLVTGNKKYADFYENTFYNTILSSQNPESGMTTYFQPMASGYFKVYGTQTQSFWCCTGSGMENFTKLGNAIYFNTEDTTFVNQYLSSVLTDEQKNLQLTQEANIPESDTVTFTVNAIDTTKEISGKVGFRLPDWMAGNATVTVNGTVVEAAEENGYAVLSDLNDGDVVKVTLPMEIKAYNLPDGENVYAFKYGPIVLSAKLGTENMKSATTGVDVTIPASKLIGEEYISDGTENISVINGTVSDFMKNINENLVKAEGKLEWNLENTDANLTFVPHYSQHTERYGIYFNYTANSDAFNATKYIKTKAQERFDAAKTDTVQPGYGQYENDEFHNMQESNSVGNTSDGTSRYAKAGGYFAYNMKTAPKEENVLEVTFRKADNGKTIKISVDDTVVYNETLNYEGDDTEYTLRIPVLADIIGSKESVVVKFESAKEKEDSAAIYNFLYMTKAYSTDTQLKLSASEGELTKTEDGYTLKVDEKATSVDLTSELATKYGYLRVNGSVVRETMPYTVDLSRSNYVTLTYTVYAEDHKTTAEYKVRIEKTTDVANRSDADKKLAYFVNCGDYDVTTLSEGDLFGIYNGVTDQSYGEDPVTGKKWGIVDTISNPLKNGEVTNNAAMTNAVFTDNTWPFETDATVTDESDKTKTNRYTKNQFENGIARNLSYAFEVPDGEYEVEMYFSDPWSCSKNPIVAAEGTTVLENTKVNEAVRTTVKVTDGTLNLDVTAPESTLCINLAYIKVAFTGTGDESQKPSEDVTTGTPSQDVTFEVKGEITGTFTGKDVAEGTIMKAEVVKPENYTDEMKKVIQGKNAVVLDLTLEKDGVTVQANGDITVCIDVPKGIDATKELVVYRVEEDGTLTELPATVKDGKITFTTDHFSKYIIAEKETTTAAQETTTTGENKKADDIAKTGDKAPVLPLFAGMLASIGAVVASSKKKKEVK